MVDHFAGEDLAAYVVNVEETYDEAWAFMEESGAPRTCLLDEDGALFNSYAVIGTGVIFPLEIVVDREGAIAYASRSYDAAALREAIRAALDAP